MSRTTTAAERQRQAEATVPKPPVAEEGAPASRRQPGHGEAQPESPRTKAEQREASTASLIQAARELFTERGYAAVSTEEIVQRAGPLGPPSRRVKPLAYAASLLGATPPPARSAWIPARPAQGSKRAKN